MSAVSNNRAVRRELDLLVTQGILSLEQQQKLSARYPVDALNLGALARWLSILGVVAAGAGLMLLIPRWVNVQALVEVGLLAAGGGLIAVGLWLEQSRQMSRTGAATQLAGALTLQGWVVALAVYHSTGSKNWPALVGICCGLHVLLSYALKNRLILIAACVNFFLWFGGQTGYVSGWGAYWLGMDYPLRFLIAGAVIAGLAWVHFRFLTGPLQGFTRVYAHFGFLVMHFALWFFSVFGYFEKEVRWDGTETQRIAFSILWAAFCGACLYLAARFKLRLIQGYGFTFLVIDVYTFYFQFVVANSASAWFVHLILVGGSLVAGGVWLERRRRRVGPVATPAP